MTQSEALAQLEVVAANVRKGNEKAEKLFVAIRRCKRLGIGTRMIRRAISSACDYVADEYFKSLAPYSN